VAQNILERYPDADLRVYVIWVKRWVTDTRAAIDGAGMVDPRVPHLWDARNVVGLRFLERFGLDLGLDYDFFLLFDPTASWGSAPPRPLSAGATVIGENKRLARDIAPLLG
jgi:hypothetical protein